MMSRRKRRAPVEQPQNFSSVRHRQGVSRGAKEAPLGEVESDPNARREVLADAAHDVARPPRELLQRSVPPDPRGIADVGCSADHLEGTLTDRRAPKVVADELREKASRKKRE